MIFFLKITTFGVGGGGGAEVGGISPEVGGCHSQFSSDYDIYVYITEK